MRIIINGSGFSIEDKCWEKVCDRCPFRFKCYSERDEIRVTTEELDRLSLRRISGGRLLYLVDKYKSGVFYYDAIFTELTGARVDGVTYHGAVSGRLR